MLTKHEEQIAFNAASDMHDDWRAKYNTDDSLPYIIVSEEGYEVNINIPFSELLPEFQKTHIMIASYIVNTLKMNTYTIDEMFSYIHDFCLELSPLSKNTNIDVPFHQLSLIEQDKTIRMYNIVLKYYI